MRSLARLSFAVLTALVMSVCFSATRTALAQTNGSSGIMFSEFRFDGPAGTSDEFVEIVNNNSTPRTIVSSDANNLKGWSAWGLVGGVATKICTIPFNTLLAPGQHFLCAKTPGYEFGNYATADDNIANYTALGLDADGGIALFSSEDVGVATDGSFSSGTGPVFREDAVGFKKLNSATFVNPQAPTVREGAGLNPIGKQDPATRLPLNPDDVREYSFVRKHVTAANGAWSGATYQDTDVNTADWVLVSNAGDFTNVTQANVDFNQNFMTGSAFDPSPPGFAGTEAATVAVFGAPGPQSKASPIERNYNSQFLRSLFDTGSAANVSPNIERNSQVVCAGSRGDLLLRFTYKNATTLTQNNLRVRWIDISTINRGNASFTAVLDLLDSTAATRNLFVNNGADKRAVTTPATANDPAPSGDGITNALAAGGAGVKTVRGTYVEGVDKTPQVLNYPSTSIGLQNFRQLNPSYVDTDGSSGTPCRVGGFNSATVATPPTGANVNNAGVTTTGLPAPLVNGGSISLEHRFGVIRQGKFLIVGIIESN